MIKSEHSFKVAIYLFNINLLSTDNKSYYEVVKALAINYWGVSKDMCEICFTEYGKPYFPKLPDKYFNLSHSGSYCICAFAESEIGIDIEEIKSINFKIANRFFSNNEKKFILEKSDIDIQSRRFFEIWTKKEAYIKYKGKGLSIPLNSFDVLSSCIDNKMRCFCKENYMISVCTDLCKDFSFDFQMI